MNGARELNPRPPSAWWAKMWPRVAAGYPRKARESLKKYRGDISRILAGIWWKLPQATRKRLVRRYDNPGAAWHTSEVAHQRFIEETLRRQGIDTSRANAAVIEHEHSARVSRRYGIPNPTRHAKKGIGLLGIAAIAGLAYWLLKKR